MGRCRCARFIVVCSVAATVACGGATTSAARPGGMRNDDSALLSEAEIARDGDRTVLETIQRLRPIYLSMARNRGSTGERVVYVDGVRVGTLEVLRGIRSSRVREVRWLDAREATIRFGTGHSAGAILIATKTGR